MEDEKTAKAVQKQAVQQPVEEKKPLLKKFPKTGKNNLVLVLGSLVIVLAGVATGWFLSGRALGDGTSPSGVAPGAETGQVGAGITDEEAFPDQAEGVLEEGGIEGEGTHHLVRDGGPSKYVYLTSTIIDLQSYKGKKVKVWGETIGGRHAGWLMDVGRIQIVD